uniref:Uncharacterized protein n=4 Tax=Phaeomonas parva TaxID=124430 RepID=A0A7S1TT25_9STRA|mmetsp:Transcript_1665/g.4688  ORF Transcript_1665/g.4688 Transcript_1665/m.4688 type:complete len:221 (+) Transcript_1665:477-1139(+)
MVVICTDGLPTDGDGGGYGAFGEAVRAELDGLPVRLTVRLCTSDDDVVEYWNNIDAALEHVSVDVLDDLESEAREVRRFQPWLTYGQPLHRLREFGAAWHVFDLLDERPLHEEEAAQLAEKLVGELPDPYADSFYKTLGAAVRRAPKTFDALTRRAQPVIDTSAFPGAPFSLYHFLRRQAYGISSFLFLVFVFWYLATQVSASWLFFLGVTFLIFAFRKD